MTTVTSSSGLSDIDSLMLTVRDRESQRLIAEAVTAYRAGSLRSALVSTWISVTYDLISKTRELSSQGEAAPRAFVNELDKAVAQRDLRKMQLIENQILVKANTELQLLAPHEYNALVRIQKDRHLCAHPAFILEDELYQPTPEQVRVHIVHAIRYLLAHAPLQGKSAIDRFGTDILGSSFPVTAEDIGTFVRARYLDRAKDVLVVNLIKTILSIPFGTDREKFIGRMSTLALTLREISRSKAAIYDDIMPAFVSRKFAQVHENVLLSICVFLEMDRRIWEWLEEADRTRIRRLVETADAETLKIHAVFDAFSIDSLRDSLTQRFEDLDAMARFNIISSHPRKEFVAPGIRLYSQAGSFRDAEQLGYSVLLPLSTLFGADDIKATLEAVSGNGQIWNAAGTPNILEHLLNNTRPLLAQCRKYWEEFIVCQIERAGGDINDHYACPELQRMLAE